MEITDFQINLDTHSKVLRVSNEKARIFYLTEAAENMWSVRTLDRNISTLYYNRIVASIDKKIVENEMKEKTKKATSKRIYKKSSSVGVSRFTNKYVLY